MARVRSFWAWGYEDRLPHDDARKALASRAAGVLGSDPTLRPYPTTDALKPPEPAYTPPVELRNIGTTDARQRAMHTYGRGYRDLVRGFAGDFSSAPDWVFYPSDEA